MLAGDIGTYSVALQGIGNVDTPYVFFQVGIPEMGPNILVYNLDFLNLTSNVRGSPPEGDFGDIEFASLNPAVNTNGISLTSGDLFDQESKIARSGAGGVESTLCTRTDPFSRSTKSVKVPPVSMPISFNSCSSFNKDYDRLTPTSVYGNPPPAPRASR